MSENEDSMYNIFMLYATHSANVQRRLQTVLDVTSIQENIMRDLINIVINDNRRANHEENINNLNNNQNTYQAYLNRPVTRLHEPVQNPLRNPLQNPLQNPLRNPLQNPLHSNINLQHPRSAPLFPFPTNNAAQDRWNGLFNQMNQRQANEEFLRPVIVRPSEQQINRATRLIRYGNVINPSNTRCPISLTTFEDDSEVMQILECGHIFVREELMNWFNMNVRCPLCRYDIRNYVVRRNMFLDESLFTPVNLESSSSFSSESLGNSLPTTPRINIPRSVTPTTPVTQNTPLLNRNISSSNNQPTTTTTQPTTTQSTTTQPTTTTQPSSPNNRRQPNVRIGPPPSFLDDNLIRNAIINDSDLDQMVNNIQNTLMSTFNTNDPSHETRLLTEIGFLDNLGNYNRLHNADVSLNSDVRLQSSVPLNDIANNNSGRTPNNTNNTTPNERSNNDNDDNNNDNDNDNDNNDNDDNNN